MKKVIAGLSLLTLIACDTGSSGSGNSGLRVSLPQSTSDIVEGDYTVSSVSRLNVFGCLAKSLTTNIVLTIVEGIVEDVTQKKYFNLVIPKAISEKVFNDLREKSKEEKINPEDFWNRLDKDIASELNDFLVYANVHNSDIDFEDLQRQAALGLTLLVEKGDFETGLKYDVQTKDGTKKVSIAFSEDADKKAGVQACDSFDLSAISLDDKLLKPSEVSTYLTCEKEDLSVSIKGYKDQEVTISYNGRNGSDTLTYLTSGLERTRNRNRSKTIESLDGDVRLKLFYDKDYVDGQVVIDKNKYYKAHVKLRGSMDENLRKLECEVEKPLNISQD